MEPTVAGGIVTRDWIPNPTGKNGGTTRLQAAKFAAEVYGDPSEFKTRKEWLEALDETLSDLARAFGHKPSATIIDVLAEMVA